jgi:shikimate kinase
MKLFIILIVLLLQEVLCYFHYNNYRYINNHYNINKQIQLKHNSYQLKRLNVINNDNEPIERDLEPLLNVIPDELSEEETYKILRKILKGTCIYFVGMMGSGKSTLGDKFAQKMDYRFMDTDEIAEFMIEMPISEFFGKSDENVNTFRNLEYQILMELAQYTRVVISTGGGIVEKNENWGLLRHGLVVFVDVTPEDIYNRLLKTPGQIEKRPLLRGDNPLQKLKDLSEKRKEKYMQADVHLQVSNNLNPDELALYAGKSILNLIKNNPPLWVTWKKNKDSVAIEAAGRMNAKATANAGVGFGNTDKLGSITYISTDDLASGKAVIPTMNKDGKVNE